MGSQPATRILLVVACTSISVDHYLLNENCTWPRVLCYACTQNACYSERTWPRRVTRTICNRIWGSAARWQKTLLIWSGYHVHGKLHYCCVKLNVLKPFVQRIAETKVWTEAKLFLLIAITLKVGSCNKHLLRMSASRSGSKPPDQKKVLNAVTCVCMCVNVRDEIVLILRSSTKSSLKTYLVAVSSCPPANFVWRAANYWLVRLQRGCHLFVTVSLLQF